MVARRRSLGCSFALAFALAGCAATPGEESPEASDEALSNPLPCASILLAGLSCDEGLGKFILDERDAVKADDAVTASYNTRLQTAHEIVMSAGTPQVRKTGEGLFSPHFIDPAAPRVNLVSRVELAEGVTEDAVLDALYGDWRVWWRHSKIESGTLQPTSQTGDGRSGSSFTFHPVAALASAVTLKMTVSPPEHDVADPIDYRGSTLVKDREITTWHYAVPVRLEGAFTVNMKLLVSTNAKGRVIFRETWPEGQITGSIKGLPSLAAFLHELAGSSKFPHALVNLDRDPDGSQGRTGWVGLMDYLENAKSPGHATSGS